MGSESAPLGSVFLIPNLLGDVATDTSLPPLVARTVARISYFLVEEEKNARRLIKQLCPTRVIQDVTLIRLNKNTRNEELDSFLTPLRSGVDVGIISEAGCPAIADPGSEVVRLAHQIGARVHPLVGPCSMVLALMGSGFNGQRWRFTGYLPIEEKDRRAALLSIERDLYTHEETQIFMETPYRNQRLFDEVIATCRAETSLCIAADLTTPHESIITKSVSEWRTHGDKLPRSPAIFLLGR